MANRKTTPEKPRRKVVLQLSLPSLFFWAFGFLVVLSWSFILGVFVGRGVLADGIEVISKLRGKIQGAKETKEEGSQSMPPSIIKEEDPQFVFFERLEKETEDAAVRMEPPVVKKAPRVEPLPTPTVPETNRHGFTVQLSAGTSEAAAARMMERLKKKGYPAYVVKTHAKSNLQYRVRCGKFETEAQAKAHAAELARREGIQGIVSRVEG
jgi:cell division protein FtsN